MKVVGVLFLVSLWGSYSYSNSCVTSLEPILELEKHVHQYIDSPKYTEYVQKKLAYFMIDPNGYVTIDSQEVFPEKLISKAFRHIPFPSEILLPSHSTYLRNFKSINSPQAGMLKKIFGDYVDWLTKILNRVSEREKVFVFGSELRMLSSEGGMEVPVWHHDGGYIAVGAALLGRGTQYLEKAADTHPKEVSRGNTMLFTALDRTLATEIPPTIHRSPPRGPKRIFLMVRYNKVE